MLCSVRSADENKDHKQKDMSISKLEYQGLLTNQA